MTAQLDLLCTEFSFWNALGLENIEHLADRRETSYVFYFKHNDPIVMTAKEFGSSATFIEIFRELNISIQAKINWEAMRQMMVAAAVPVTRIDAWATKMNEWIQLRFSTRDYLVERRALNVLKNNSATSVGYGEELRVVDLNKFAEWASRTRGSAADRARLGLRDYLQALPGQPEQYVIAPVELTAKQVTPGRFLNYVNGKTQGTGDLS